LLHCDAGVAPTAGPKGRLLLDMRGAVVDAADCYFRRKGKGRRFLSVTAAAGLCLLPVARAFDDVVMVREPSTANAGGKEGDVQALLTVDNPICWSRWRHVGGVNEGFQNLL